MIREDTNKNIIERFPSMESDLKLHAIPQLNKNKEDIWTAIKILAFYYLSCFLSYITAMLFFCREISETYFYLHIYLVNYISS